MNIKDAKLTVAKEIAAIAEGIGKPDDLETAALYGLSNLYLKTEIKSHQDEDLNGYNIALMAVSDLLNALKDTNKIDNNDVLAMFTALMLTTDGEDPDDVLHF